MAKRGGEFEDEFSSRPKRPVPDEDIPTKKKKLLLSLNGLETNSAALVDNISKGLDALEGAWYYLYGSNIEAKMVAIQKLIHESIKYSHSRLDTIKNITVSVAMFGPLGAGKSFILNHLLNYDLSAVLPDIGFFELLRSGEGVSKTPVPVKIKHGSQVQITVKRKANEASNCNEDVEMCFISEELSKESLQSARKALDEIFQNETSLSSVEYVQVAAPLPVFDRLKSAIASNSYHREVEVQTEFVDLPGPGDKTGDSSIAKQLDQANVIMFLKTGQSGREVSFADLAEVFKRRQVFQYPDRPKFVHVINAGKNPEGSSSVSLESSERVAKANENLQNAWEKLEKRDDLDESYDVVYERLPQLSGAKMLQKMREESEAIFFDAEVDDTITSLAKAISSHVKEVQLKKKAHPIVQEIFKVAKQLRTRTQKVIYQKRKKAGPGKNRGKDERNSRRYKSLEKYSLIIPKPDHAEEENEKDLCSKVLDISNVVQAKMIQDVYAMLIKSFFNQEIVIEYLRAILENALEIHWKNLLDEAELYNQLSSSEASRGFIELGEMLCCGRVGRYMTDQANGYIASCVTKLKLKRNKRIEKLWSTANEEDKKKYIAEISQQLLVDLKAQLQKPDRKHTLMQLLHGLVEDLNELISSQLHCMLDDENTLCKILDRIDIIIAFFREKIRDVNPHLSHEGTILDHEMEFPKLQTHDDHQPNAFAKVDPTKVLKDVSEIISKKLNADPFQELEGKLNLPPGTLDPPHGLSGASAEWAKILLHVLFEKEFFGRYAEEDQKIPESLKIEFIIEEHHNQARQCLFRYQVSNATCTFKEDLSIAPGEIRMKINESHTGIEAFVSEELRQELHDMSASIEDCSSHLAPIFIPTDHPGPDQDNTGNLYLEKDPWSREASTGNGDENEDENSTEGHGLAGLNATIFLVVDPSHLEECKSTVSKKKAPPGSKITVRYVVLPQNGRGIGVSRAIIKMLAECLDLPRYWTIDEDIKCLYEFDGNAKRWQECTFGRALLYGQRIFKDCLEKTVNHFSADQRHELIENLVDGLFPDWAMKSKTKRQARQLFDESSFAHVLRNHALLKTPFNEVNIKVDSAGNRNREEELQGVANRFITQCKKVIRKDTFKRFAGVSIGHQAGRRYDYVAKMAGKHYRKSDQRYQMVLHNTDALKGFNYLQDEVVLNEAEGTVLDEQNHSIPHLGCNGAENSFCQALSFFGVFGYQVIPVVHAHKTLKDAVGLRRAQCAVKVEDDDENVK